CSTSGAPRAPHSFPTRRSSDLPLDAERSWIALAQVRPTTGPTALPHDIVGTVRADGEQPLLATAAAENRICREGDPEWRRGVPVDRKSTRLNSSHVAISYAVFC